MDALNSSVVRRRLKVLQVDPSLFTAPYDVALGTGLAANGVEVCWATRGLRPGEEDLLGKLKATIFYPLTDGPRRRTGRVWKMIKGVEHGIGLARLARMAADRDVDLVHFQWGLVPRLDRRAILSLRRHCPVVLTVHDVQPLNGARASGMQVSGFDALLGAADQLIVHLDAGKRALIKRGLAAEKINVVPHGMLPLPSASPEPRNSGRWRVVLFGRLQDYKGVDIAVEAAGRMPREDRDKLDLVIAGEPLIELAPIRARIDQLGLGQTVDLRPRRLGEAEMASLLRSADAFLFPYRTIEASGVLHLVADLGRWIIASDIGAFHGLLAAHPGAGELVAPGDAEALAGALARSINRQPTSAPGSDTVNWSEIGAMTRRIYERALGPSAEGAVRRAASG